jgi:hypothetical protein
MESQKLLYNKIGDDESYTPKYAVLPIVKYVKEYMKRIGINSLTVWCPFDKEEDSEFFKVLSNIDNVKVICSHIDNDGDFFSYEPDEWDVIISNPPFKEKRKFFERALSLNKPFALIMTNTWLNDKYSKWVYKEAGREMQLLMFDKRIHFEQKGCTMKKTTFSSSYFCCDFLPRQIVIEEM